MFRKLIFIGVVFFVGLWLLTSLSIYLPKVSLPLNSEKDNAPLVSVVAENLDTPWGIVFLPDESMLFTERAGKVRFIDSKRVLKASSLLILKDVEEVGEGGLLGIAIHPNFSKNHFVYLYYTYKTNEGTFNKVVRFRYGLLELAVACSDNGSNCNKASKPTLEEDKVIVDKIPASVNHNGGRIKFGPDGYLYITTGDAQEPSLAQDKNSLAGKILRVTNDGRGAPGNPFNNLVYSYGHRNPQGLAWRSDGLLWETEHGPSGGSFGLGNDELNTIHAGENYGWPIIQGDKTQRGMTVPVRNSGTSTWAPAGSAIVNDILYFAGLRGAALYSLDIKPDYRMIVTPQKKIVEHFKNKFGRIREVVLGPDNFLYITTSNQDGRGEPKFGDDKIIKINPTKLK